MARVPMLILLLLVAAPQGVAAEGDDDRPSDDEWDRAPRELTLQLGSDGFVLRSGHSENGTGTQTYVFDTETATLRWSVHFPDNESQNEAGRDAGNASIRFNGLMEFDDVDGDGRLGIADSVVKNARFTDMMFPRVTSREPEPGQQEVTIRFTLPDLQRGTVTLRFLFTGHVTEVGDDTLLPSATRFDISVDRYLYRERNGTSLALDTRVGNAPVLRGDGIYPQAKGDHQPHFIWNRTAIVDGESQSVGLTVQSYASGPADEAVVVFAYPRGTTITHDGQFGFAQVTPESPLVAFGGKIIGEWRVFTLALVLAALVVAAATYPRIRSRL